MYELNSDADGKIHIDSLTGSVTAAVVFDHETTNRFLFHVIAVDRSVERRFSTALVTIEVIDANDETPHFVQDRCLLPLNKRIYKL